MKVVTEQELQQLREAFSIGVKWFELLNVSVPEEEHQQFDDAYAKVVEIQKFRDEVFVWSDETEESA